MGLFRDAVDFFRPNPLNSMLKKLDSKQAAILIVWNRGLGDIALGLFAMVKQIRDDLPEAKVVFLTRPDLEEGFRLLNGIEVIASQKCVRGQPVDVESILDDYGKSVEDYDLVMEKPDPTRWTKWQIGTLTPKLHWDPSWDELSYSFGLDKNKRYLGAHVHSETGQYYGYEKNWPFKFWYELIRRVTQEKQMEVVLFGFRPEPEFDLEGVIDLRGKTNLFQLLALIKTHLDYLVAPDSGVLSLAYYLNVQFPLKMVSLWSDPRQGILKQNVSSPNAELFHIPLIGKDESVANISVERVLQTLFS